MNLENKRAIVTGSTKGIGFAVAQALVQEGAKVVISSRHLEDIERAVGRLDELAQGRATGKPCDVRKPEQVRELIQYCSDTLGGVDVLINNAGILRNESLGSIDADAIRQQFEVNALAPLLVTEALMGQFTDAAKLALITSRMGSVADNTSGGRYGYRMSKAALNIAAMSLAQDLKPMGVAVAILHPGLVGTEMIGGYGDITPDQAAERLAQRIDELTLATSGTFWHSNGEVLPW